MRIENYIVIGIVALIIGAVVFYLVREKKKGAKCIGCPYAKECGNKCGCHVQKNSEKSDKPEK